MYLTWWSWSLMLLGSITYHGQKWRIRLLTIMNRYCVIHKHVHGLVQLLLRCIKIRILTTVIIKICGYAFYVFCGILITWLPGRHALPQLYPPLMYATSYTLFVLLAICISALKFMQSNNCGLLTGRLLTAVLQESYRSSRTQISHGSMNPTW